MLDKPDLDDRRSHDDHSSLVVQTPIRPTTPRLPPIRPVSGVPSSVADLGSVDTQCLSVGDAPNVLDHNPFAPPATYVECTPSEADQITCARQPIAVDLAPIITAIIAEHMRRQAAIKAQKRLDQSAGAMARRLCGWRLDLPEKERTAANKRAGRIIDQLEKQKDVSADDALVAEQLLPFVMATLAGRAPFDQLRKNAEKAMVGRAKSLPVWPWVNAVKGIDAGGLAAIVGEAGDLSNYATVAKLWKRLGLAVMDGKRQGNPGKTAKADDWIAHGYSGRRRSVVWNVGHALVMSNGDGEYRRVYLARKEYEKARDPEMSKGHAANRAQRYMEKRLIRDLWKAWRAASLAHIRY